MASPHVAGVAALGLEIAPSSSVAQISQWITNTATPGVIGDAGTDSPNLLVYSRLSASPPSASTPATTLPITTVPAAGGGGGGDGGGGGGDGGGGGGGGDSDGGEDAAPESTTTIPSSTVPRPAITTPAVVLGKVLPGSDIFNPILGSQIPEVAPQALSKPSSNKVVGNNVVLKVTAPAQSTVYIYRDGLLVKVVPSAAAQSIKIARNKVGKSSFQILIVDKNGKISISKKSTVRVTVAAPIVALSKVLPGSDIVNQVLGSSIPKVALRAVVIRSSSKVVGNNVVLKVTAPARSKVYIYRDGLLVKVVPATAAQSIKIAKNKVGKSSFQILIVDKNGKISISKKSTVRVRKASK